MRLRQLRAEAPCWTWTAEAVMGIEARDVTVCSLDKVTGDLS